jgi:hypothetical protein
MENLDLAIGRNTVVEFRDVGIILKVRVMLVTSKPNFVILGRVVALTQDMICCD